MILCTKGYGAGLDDLAEATRTAVFKITTDGVDRDGEVVIPSGLDLSDYRKNPVVLAIHDSQKWPIGRSPWVKSYNRDRELRAAVKFAETEQGEEAWQLVRSDMANGASIGFLPDRKSMGPPTAPELKARPDWAGARNVHRGGKLVEWSICPVPCNGDALKVAVSKALAGTIDLPPLPPHRTLAQVRASALAEAARKLDPAAIVERTVRAAIDRQRGL